MLRHVKDDQPHLRAHQSQIKDSSAAESESQKLKCKEKPFRPWLSLPVWALRTPKGFQVTLIHSAFSLS